VRAGIESFIEHHRGILKQIGIDSTFSNLQVNEIIVYSFDYFENGLVESKKGRKNFF